MSWDEDWEKTFLAKQSKSSARAATTTKTQQPLGMDRATESCAGRMEREKGGGAKNPTVPKPLQFQSWEIWYKINSCLQAR